MASVTPVNAGGKGKAKSGTPTLSIGPPGHGNALDRVRLAVFPDARTTRAVLTLTISRIKERRRDSDTKVELVLPRHARVVGLAATLGTRPRLVATFAPMLALTDDGPQSGAWLRFIERAHGGLDTALLMYGYEVDDVAHYDVRVSPMKQGVPATIEIVIELSATRSLAIESGHQVSDFALEIDSVLHKVKPLLGNFKAQRIELPKPKPAPRNTDFDVNELIPPAAVAPDTSLLVDGSLSTP